jgi:hypothetical protein
MSQFTGFVANYPRLTMSMIGILAMLLAMVAIVLRWVILARSDSKRRGFRVFRIAPGKYVYQERGAERPFEEPPFWLELLWSFGIGWPRPSESNRQLQFRCTTVGLHHTVHLPGPEDWDHAVPDWAKDRRDDIVTKVHEALSETFGRKNVV